MCISTRHLQPGTATVENIHSCRDSPLISLFWTNRTVLVTATMNYNLNIDWSNVLLATAASGTAQIAVSFIMMVRMFFFWLTRGNAFWFGRGRDTWRVDDYFVQKLLCTTGILWWGCAEFMDLCICLSAFSSATECRRSADFFQGSLHFRKTCLTAWHFALLKIHWWCTRCSVRTLETTHFIWIQGGINSISASGAPFVNAIALCLIIHTMQPRLLEAALQSGSILSTGELFPRYDMISSPYSAQERSSACFYGLLRLRMGSSLTTQPIGSRWLSHYSSCFQRVSFCDKKPVASPSRSRRSRCKWRSRWVLPVQ